MPRDEALDDLLREYLQREKMDPIRIRLSNIANWQVEHETKDAGRHEEFKLSHQALVFRVQSLESKATEIASEVEETGRHNLADLKEKGKKYDRIVLAVIVAILSGGGLVEVAHQFLK
jgi:hypothetical protein